MKGAQRFINALFAAAALAAASLPFIMVESHSMVESRSASDDGKVIAASFR